MLGELRLPSKPNTASPSSNPPFVGSGEDLTAAGPPSTVSIRRPCGVVLSAQGSLNDLNAVPAFVIASRVLLFICLRRLFRKHFSGGPRWPTPLKIICRWPRSGAAQILREFDRAISFGGISPLRSGQQSSCACDCRYGNGDDEKLERSGERTIFELVDSRKQRESDEADGEYVEGGPHLECSVPDCRGVATASSVSGGLALTRIYRSTGPLRFRTMECDGAPVVAFLRLGKPHGTPPPTRLLLLGLG